MLFAGALACGGSAEVAPTTDEFGSAEHQLVGAGTGKLMYYNWATKHKDMDWLDFFYFTKHNNRGYLPDIITVSEMYNQHTAGGFTCAGITEEYTRHIGSSYSFDCRQTNMQGGAGVIWRSGRFSYVNHRVFYLERKADGVNCSLASGTGWAGIVVRLRDNNDNRYINVSSVHMPTDGTDSDFGCAWSNMKRINNEFAALGGASLTIAGGDFNQQRTQGCWYDSTIAGRGSACGTNLGYTDMQHLACGGNWGCTDTKYTKGTKRIDYVLTKSASFAGGDSVTGSYVNSYASLYESDASTYFSDHAGFVFLMNW